MFHPQQEPDYKLFISIFETNFSSTTCTYASDKEFIDACEIFNPIPGLI